MLQNIAKNTPPKLSSVSQLRGRKSAYQICGQFRANNHDVWPAFALDTRNPVVIKHAPPDRLHKEIQALRLCKGSPYIRQLVDTTDSPPSMVLERLDTSLYAASCQQPLEKGEIKQIIKSVLHGLIVLHGFGRIQNDIKPDNILANRGTGSTRFSDIKLSDLGDSAFEDASHNLDRSISGTAVYRAPEMILKAQLTTAVDIWAVGATALFFLVGDHFFAPKLLDPTDEMIHDNILERQMRCLGPFPEHFIDIVPDSHKDYFRQVQASSESYPNRWPDALASVVDPEDEDFIRMLLKPDPRDRPTAHEALDHPWLRDD